MCLAQIRDWKVSPTVLYGVMGLIEYDTSGMFMIIVATLVLLDAAYHKRARSDKSFTILQFNEVRPWRHLNTSASIRVTHAPLCRRCSSLQGKAC